MAETIFSEWFGRCIARADSNQSGTAARMGIAESTLRHYLRKPNQPTPNSNPLEFVEQLAKRSTPDEIADLFQRLAAGKVTVTAVSRADAPPVAVTPEQLRDAAMEVTSSAVDYQKTVNKALGDNLIDVDEQTEIFAAGMKMSRAKLFMAWLTEHCPVARRVG